MTEHDKLRATIARWQDRAEWLQAALIDAEVEIERLTRAAPANEWYHNPFQCLFCNSKFASDAIRNEHLQKQHPGSVAPAPAVLDPEEVRRVAQAQTDIAATNRIKPLSLIHCMRCGDVVDARPKPFSVMGGDEDGHVCPTRALNVEVPPCSCGNVSTFSCTREGCYREKFLQRSERDKINDMWRCKSCGYSSTVSHIIPPGPGFDCTNCGKPLGTA